MKILVLCYEYPPVGGGGGRVARQVAIGLAGRGHEVRVLTGGLRSHPPEETVDGLPVLRVRAPRQTADTCSVPEMAAWLIWSAWPALQLVRSWKPDVIHAHFAVPTGALALFLHLLTGTPYVLTTHLGDVPGGVPEQTAGLFRLIKPFTRPVWRCAAGITAVSSHVANLGREAYGLNPQVILNALPEDAPSLEEPPSLPEGRSGLRGIYVGRFSEQKNPLLAVAALAETSSIQFDFVGDGPLRSPCEQATQKAGLEPRVRFHGWLNAPEVGLLMRQADFLLMTSRSEGLPVVLLEAIERGLAVISTDIPGIRDGAVHQKNALLCRPEATALANAIKSLESEPGLLQRLQRESTGIAAKFAPDQIFTAYEQVLRAAVDLRN